LDLPVMDVSFYLTVGVEPVSANRTPGFHRGSDEAMKRYPVEIGDSCHADATDAFAVLLGCDDDQHLAVDQAAGCSPRFGCAPVGFIYLHHASQTLPAGAHHRLAQLVEHQPRRLVAAQSKNPLEAKRAHSILLAGHVPHRSKPYRQGEDECLETRFPRAPTLASDSLCKAKVRAKSAKHSRAGIEGNESLPASATRKDVADTRHRRKSASPVPPMCADNPRPLQTAISWGRLSQVNSPMSPCHCQLSAGFISLASVFLIGIRIQLPDH